MKTRLAGGQPQLFLRGHSRDGLCRRGEFLRFSASWEVCREEWMQRRISAAQGTELCTQQKAGWRIQKRPSVHRVRLGFLSLHVGYEGQKFL